MPDRAEKQVVNRVVDKGRARELAGRLTLGCFFADKTLGRRFFFAGHMAVFLGGIMPIAW